MILKLKIQKSEPLSIDCKDLHINLCKLIDQSISPIRIRHLYIVDRILKTFKVKVKITNSDFHTLIDLCQLGNDIIFFSLDDYHSNTNKKLYSYFPYYIADDSIQYSLGSSYPTRWLFENFEEELANMANDFFKIKKAKYEEDAKKIKNLKAKLSKDEFQFLIDKLKK